MSSEEFEKRMNNRLDAIIENQARFSEDMAKMQEAIAGLIQVARMHDEQIDRNTEQIDRNTEQIARLEKQVEETSEAVKQTTGNLNALIRVVDQHLSNHP